MPIAFLADRLDLLPDGAIEEMRALAPDPKDLLRRQMGGIIVRTNELFTKYRRAWSGEPERPTPARVGRNDPCPCGSGKKHKRCCAGRRDAPA